MTFQSRPMNQVEESSEKMSIEAFSRWVEARDGRYELIDGVPRLQPWVKRSHSLIVGNVSFSLQTQLDREVYSLHQGDFAVATGPSSIRYADVLIEPLGEPLDGRTADKAIVLIEVLSQSTAHIDFGPKAQEYLTLPFLCTYLIVDQEKRCAWQWNRAADGNWPADPSVIEEPNAVIAISAIGCHLRFDDISRNVR